MGKRDVQNDPQAFQENLSSPFAHASSPGASYRLAMAVTYTINPMTLAPVLFALTLWHAGAPASEVVRVTSVAFVFFGLIPLAYLVWMVRQRQALSVEVRHRERRTRPFLVGIAASAVGLGAVWWTGTTVTALTAALAAGLTVNAVLLALVTLWWKISVHAASTAGFVAMLWFVATVPDVPGVALRPTAVVVLGLLVPLVMWARVRVQAHTSAQVWAGALFGLIVPYAELHLFLTTGLFGTL